MRNDSDYELKLVQKLVNTSHRLKGKIIEQFGEQYRFLGIMDVPEEDYFYILEDWRGGIILASVLLEVSEPVEPSYDFKPYDPDRKVSASWRDDTDHLVNKLQHLQLGQSFQNKPE